MRARTRRQGTSQPTARAPCDPPTATSIGCPRPVSTESPSRAYSARTPLLFARDCHAAARRSAVAVARGQVVLFGPIAGQVVVVAAHVNDSTLAGAGFW